MERAGTLQELSRSASERHWSHPLASTGQAGPLSGAPASLQGRCSTFPATLPRAHFGSEEREQAGSTGHHHTHLVSLPSAAPAWQASAPGINWCSNYGKQYRGSSKKLIELPTWLQAACQNHWHTQPTQRLLLHRPLF